MSESHSITQARLHELFDYHEDGYLTWKIKKAHQIPIGAKAGTFLKSKSNLKYLHISIDYKKYLAHRLIWIFHHGKIDKPQIDHIDGNRENNKIENLRVATNSQNGKNKGLMSSNQSGLIGVSWHKKSNRWTAQIGVDGKKIYLGIFKDKFEASKEYQKAVVKYFGEWARR